MSKRSNAEGSIYRRKDGKWVGALTIGFDTNGKQKRKYYYGKTKKEVQEKLAEAKYLLQIGQLNLKSIQKITFGKWLNIWLEDYKKKSVKPGTYISYQQIIQLYLLPTLGDIKLQDLNTNQIQKAINGLEVSPRTVEYAVTIAKQALNQAVAEGYIYTNPATHISLPWKATSKVKSLSQEEVKKIFAVIQNPIHYIIYYTLLSTGIRRGEVLALNWDYFNYKNKTLEVCNAVTKDIEGKWVISTPKTDTSIRNFSIPVELVNILKKHQHEQNKQILLAGSLYNNQNLILAKDNGDFYTPDYITRRFKAYADKAEINSNLHELRHTFATWGLQSGMDITTISKMLGHKDVTTTLNTYSHLLPDSTERVATTINSLLPKPKINYDFLAK